MKPNNTNVFGNAENFAESILPAADALSDTYDSNNADLLDSEIEFRNATVCGQETTCIAKTELLALTDQICRQNNIPYFAIAHLLTSCVHYHDFLPDEADREWDLGLIRKDYERLLSILRKYSFPPHIRFVEYAGETNIIPREAVFLEIAKTITFNDIQITKLFHIRFLPFDKLPANRDVRDGFIAEVEKECEMFRTIRKWRSFKSAKEGLRSYAFLHFYYGKRNIKQQFKKVNKLSSSFNNDPEASEYARIMFGRTKPIAESSLFPLQEIEFRGLKIFCPKDVTPWTPIFDEELDKQVSSIQKADLGLLSYFDSVCRKLKIGYFVCGGTMLGYMRHGGFIPWDDDVDVAMLREDYDRFLQEAAPYFTGDYFLQTRESDPKIPYLFSKVRLNNTEYVTAYNEYRDFHKGICLDIFPFDYLPNDPTEREQFIEKVLDYSAKHNEVANGQTPIVPGGPAPRTDTEKKYAAMTQKKRNHYNSISLSDTQAAYIKEATKYNADAKKNGLTTVASFVPSYTYIDLEDLLPYQDGDFNGIKVMVPKRPDIFLTMQYGDYMQLPPKHMQVAHKLVRWSVDVEKSKEKEGEL